MSPSQVRFYGQRLFRAEPGAPHLEILPTPGLPPGNWVLRPASGRRTMRCVSIVAWGRTGERSIAGEIQPGHSPGTAMRKKAAKDRREREGDLSRRRFLAGTGAAIVAATAAPALHG